VFQKGHKKLESSGRRVGTPNKKTADIKALAFQSAPDAITELVRLLKHSRNEAVRVSAAKELLDRALGKAMQPHSGESGEGPVIVQVITGVPLLRMCRAQPPGPRGCCLPRDQSGR
jgi:hypothetical protein